MTNIPDYIEIDVQKSEIGDSLHISTVALPEGVRPAIERDFTIATIAGRMKKVEEETAEAAEGEAAEGEGGAEEQKDGE